MSDERGDVHRGAMRPQRVAPLGVRLPRPRDPGGERVDGDVLDEAEHVAGADAVGRPHRGERQRAVAGDHRGHAVLRHRIDQRIPPHRRVVVRVAVDEPGRDVRATGVDDGLAVGARGRAPISVIAPSRMRTSASRAGAPVPSTTVPPRTSRFPVMVSPLSGSNANWLGRVRPRPRAADDRGRARGRGRTWARRRAAGRSRWRRSARP